MRDEHYVLRDGAVQIVDPNTGRTMPDRSWELGLQQMIEHLVEHGVLVRLCRTCAVARGIERLPLIPGVAIGTLVEMAKATIEADKVITF